MQMKPPEVKLYCLIGHMTTMCVASLCNSFPSGGHTEVIQENLIAIYQAGNQWSVQEEILFVIIGTCMYGLSGHKNPKLDILGWSTLIEHSLLRDVQAASSLVSGHLCF